MKTYNVRSILDPNLGVQGVLEAPTPDTQLPQARSLVTNVAREAGLAELYRQANFRSKTLAGLQPEIDDDASLRPELLDRHLRGALAALSHHRDPRVRRFLRDDLSPLMANGQLLRDYLNMAVGG